MSIFREMLFHPYTAGNKNKWAGSGNRNQWSFIELPHWSFIYYTVGPVYLETLKHLVQYERHGKMFQGKIGTISSTISWLAVLKTLENCSLVSHNKATSIWIWWSRKASVQFLCETFFRIVHIFSDIWSFADKPDTLYTYKVCIIPD
jgi:hypothetical protein